MSQRIYKHRYWNMSVWLNGPGSVYCTERHSKRVWIVNRVPELGEWVAYDRDDKNVVLDPMPKRSDVLMVLDQIAANKEKVTQP
jgi:hypothetical protein